MSNLITAVRDLLDTYDQEYRLDPRLAAVNERMTALREAYAENRRGQNERSARKYYRQRAARLETIEREEDEPRGWNGAGSDVEGADYEVGRG